MENQHILRIPRSDEDGSFVIVRAMRFGSLPLDLKLAGTDNESAFATTIYQRQVSKLRDRRYKGSDAEWEAALSKCLLHKPPSAVDEKALSGLEIVASIPEENRLYLVLRKSEEGIIQRLGSVSLPMGREEDIDLFEWAGVAAQSTFVAKSETISLKNQLNDQQETVDLLRGQLKDLIRAKEEHETQLLEKFTQLLNSKKLKIRDQQRLLAGVKAEPTPTAEVQKPKQSSRQQIGASRPFKRKAKDIAPVSEPEPNAGAMQAGQAGMEDETDTEEEIAEASSRDKSDFDETEDEDDLQASSQRGNSGDRGKDRVIRTVSQRAATPQSPDEPPLRRELPFKPQSTRQHQSKPLIQVELDDDETDDDEL